MKKSFLYAGALSALALITMPERGMCVFVGNLSDAVQGSIIGGATAVNWINYGNAAAPAAPAAAPAVPVASASPAPALAPASQGLANNSYGPGNYQQPHPDPEDNPAIQREAAELMTKHTRN